MSDDPAPKESAHERRARIAREFASHGPTVRAALRAWARNAFGATREQESDAWRAVEIAIEAEKRAAPQ